MTAAAEAAEGARTAAVTQVEAFLASSGLTIERSAEHAWSVVLAGEHKRTVPVRIDVGEWHLTIQSFFLRAPDENEGGLYAYLLGRHLRSYVLRFAKTEAGDLLIIGVVPHRAVTVAELDRLLGQLLSMADDAFNSALRLGFGSYIEREQAWRERRGVPRNPIS